MPGTEWLPEAPDGDGDDWDVGRGEGRRETMGLGEQLFTDFPKLVVLWPLPHLAASGGGFCGAGEWRMGQG